MENEMTKVRNIVCVVTTMLGMAACVPAYKVPVSKITDPIDFSIIDKRSDNEKQGGTRSNLISSCEYGITDLGESEIEPPRLEILRAHLQSDKDLRTELQGKRVEVHSFKVIRNWQISLRRMVQKNHSGALANTMTAGCFAGPDIGGSYTIAENPNGLPSFTILLRISIDARTYTVKHFETASTFDETRSMVDGNVLPRVVTNALNKLSKAIKGSA